jgi:hypothetical protein
MGDVDRSVVMTVGEGRNLNFHKAIHPDADGPSAGNCGDDAGSHSGREHGIGGSHITDGGR